MKHTYVLVWIYLYNWAIVSHVRIAYKWFSKEKKRKNEYANARQECTEKRKRNSRQKYVWLITRGVRSEAKKKWAAQRVFYTQINYYVADLLRSCVLRRRNSPLADIFFLCVCRSPLFPVIRNETTNANLNKTNNKTKSSCYYIIDDNIFVMMTLCCVTPLA